jgi:hypothetical protein
MATAKASGAGDRWGNLGRIVVVAIQVVFTAIDKTKAG